MKVSEIMLQLNDVSQLLIAADSIFYRKRMLTPDAEELIIEEAKKLSANDQIEINIHVRSDTANRKEEVSTAIQEHFTYRRKKSERQLRSVIKLGWKSLLFSIALLAFLVSLTFVLVKLLPEGTLFITFRELLVILGWVALWRPADILLFDWRPIKRELILFRKLEQSNVHVILDGGPGDNRHTL